ncbi:MAG: HlyD family efflux transporter periplasmic adaptor subunit [Methylococcales bacterium]|nr:HlyD family efflux transporter periplasmic adaptor subunit [Methylococcales bacterium]
MNSTANPHLLKLTQLLQLERRARSAPASELPFVIVNETADLIHYRQALLWPRGLMRLEAASGVANPEANSPYALWLAPLFKHFSASLDGNAITAFSAQDLPLPLVQDWQDFAPEQGLWVPLPTPLGSGFVLMLFRETPWSASEIQVLSYLAEAYGHALALSQAVAPPRPWRQRLLQKKIQLALAIAMVVLACLPIRQSVLAEAEVIPYQPALVRAPLDGVVDSFFVQPNASVTVGQALFSLDQAQLQSRLSVAEKTRDIAETEYLQASQQALQEPVIKAKLAGLKSKWEQQAAEVDYVRTLLARCLVTATRAGVAVFDDPNDWLGRPVSQGEKILAVADPEAVELEIRLPMDDLIDLKSGDHVLFFPNVTPQHPLSATLSYFSYRASPSPAAVMVYRLKARFVGGTSLPRLGYRGVAKLYGSQRPFLLWLLRKPLQTARLWLAW